MLASTYLLIQVNQSDDNSIRGNETQVPSYSIVYMDNAQRNFESAANPVSSSHLYILHYVRIRRSVGSVLQDKIILAITFRISKARIIISFGILL